MAHPLGFWPLALLTVAGFLAVPEATTLHSARAEARQRAAQHAAEERQELARERLECRAERTLLIEAVASRQAECEEEAQHFRECRARRPQLEGAELVGCGIGIAVGLAAGGLAHPWGLGECGVAEPPASREPCPVPACEEDLAAIEREVFLERGLSELPRCDVPAA